jgi:signal transduction histidine kinase
MSSIHPVPADAVPPGHPGAADPGPAGPEPELPRASRASFLRTPFTSRTWAECLYGLIGLPLGVVGFSLTVVFVSLGAGLLVTVIGVFVFAFAVVLGRWLGALHRGLLNTLLHERIKPPARFRSRRSGFFGWAIARLGDPVGWRGLAHQLVRFPLAVATFTVTVGFWAYTLAGLTYWFWWRFLPEQRGPGGVMHRGAALWNTDTSAYFLDTWPRRLALVGIGLVLLWLTPWIVRGFVSLDRLLGRALLGPVSVSQRVRDLEASRTDAVNVSNEQLRRIERDLHDGTQARLVALAMNLGQAKEDLASGDPEAAERARTLVEGAHQQTKETLTELRDLARGIHPPVLDNGLEAALASMAARSPIRVTLAVDLGRRPSPVAETICYFAVAELVTNAIKHSQASGISVRIRERSGDLVFAVTDNGRGGALPGAGSGLAGVERRLRTVDGTLEIDSPIGGPTTMTGVLPIEA